MSEQPDAKNDLRKISTAILYGILAGVVVAVIACIWVSRLSEWNRRTEPVFTARPHVVLPFALIHQHEPKGYKAHWDIPRDAPLFQLSSRLMDRLGRTYPVLMDTQLLLFVLLVCVLGMIGWFLGGPFAGALTAAFASCVPAVLESTLAFDDHLFNMTLTALSVLLVLVSDGFRRILPATLAGAVAGFVLKYCFVPSNGILSLLAVCSAAIGAFFEILYRDKESMLGDASSPMMRLQWAKMGRRLVGFIAFFAGVYFAALRYESLDYTYYIFRDADRALAASTGSGLYGFFAYLDLLARYQLGPIFLVALAWGFGGVFLGKHKGRWALTAWLVLPLLILSMSQKKNLYYTFYFLIAAAPICGVGLTSLAWQYLRWIIGCALALAAFWTSWNMIAREPVLYRWNESFESGPSFYVQKPVQNLDPYGDQVGTILRAARERRGPETQPTFLAIGTGDALESFQFDLLLLDRDAIFYNARFSPRPPPDIADAFLIHLRKKGEIPEIAARALWESDIEASKKRLGDKSDSGRLHFLESRVETIADYKPVLETKDFLLFDR
jgi:hypothetical protein